ncbi:MAG: helix-turn-helix domain-containing protein [Candidatus Brocadiales bacterium]
MYITIPQLAKMLGVNRTTVYRKVKSGEITATKIGHAYLISNEEISKVLGKELTKNAKERIDSAVKKTVKEYGEVLKRLGSE